MGKDKQQPISTKDRFDLWYDKNKTEMNKKRRDRYATDSTYRQSIIDAKATSTPSPPRKARVKGVLITVYSLAYIAQELGKTTQAIRNWELRGIIPSTTVKGHGRWYSEKQWGFLTQLHHFYEDHKQINRKDKNELLHNLTTIINDNWEK